MAKNKKRIGSIKNELIVKSREAMLTAVQIFNNPNIQFKSESFIVLAIISWTYLLHAYYRGRKIEYRHHKIINGRTRFDKTTRGACKFWELERCLNYKQCPIDKISKENLLFLIGLRHEIEHQMTSRIDDYLTARFQSCCLNYNDYVKKFFGNKYAIDNHLSFSLQFSSISEDHVNQLREFIDLPKNIASYINAFDDNISEEEFNSPKYSFRVLFVPKIANTKGQADKVIEFIKADSPEAKTLNKEYVAIKESEKQKYRPTQIIDAMKEKGFEKFNMHHHTQLWKNDNAKDIHRGFGVKVVDTWYWYSKWLRYVEEHCKKNTDKYM